MIYSSIFRIAIPSVLFASLIWFPKKILRGQALEWESFLIETIGGCSMWFTSALVVAYISIIILLLSRIKSIWFYVGVGVLVACVGKIAFDSGLTISDNNNFPWYWKSSMAAVFYMSIGGLYRKYENFISKTLKFDHWPILILIAVVYCCYCLLDFRAYAGGLDASPLTISSVMLSIVGILLLVGFCKNVPTTKFSDYWGRNTIGLYFVCGAIPNTVAIVLQKFMPVGTLMVLICWFLSFAVALVVVYFLNRYLPFMFDIRKLRIKHNEI